MLKDGNNSDASFAGKCTKSQSHLSSIEKMARDKSCNEGLPEVPTYQLDKWVHFCANLLGDSELLGQLGIEDIVALKAMYHSKCIVRLYKHTRKVQFEGLKDASYKQPQSTSQSAFA